MIKIFVVEDDMDLNRFVSSSLKSAGYEVISCFDGLEALEKMVDETTTMVLLMPHIMPRWLGSAFLMKYL